MNEPDPIPEQLRSLGTLKLPEKEVQPFLDALGYYGHERVAAYLRVTAHALIAHHQALDELKAPLAFELVRKPSPPKPPFITRGALIFLPLATLPGLVACALLFNEVLERNHEPTNQKPTATAFQAPVHGPRWSHL